MKKERPEKDLDKVAFVCSNSGQNFNMNSLAQPTIEVQGGRLTFRQPQGMKRRGGGLRGAIKEFSSESRRNLMKRFASLDFRKMAAEKTDVLFITLTTTPEYWQREDFTRQALERFRDRLEYQYGRLGVFWRKERGIKNGMLHYHLLVFGKEYISADWIRRTWTECMRYEGQHESLRVDVEKVEGERIFKYVAKYAAKGAYEGAERMGSDAVALSKAHISGNEIENTQNISKNEENLHNGHRWWGTWNSEKLPFGRSEMLEMLGMTVDVTKRVKRWLRRLFKKYEEKRFQRINDQGLVKEYGEHAATWSTMQRMCCLPDDYLWKKHRKWGTRGIYSEWLRVNRGGWTVFMNRDIIDRMVIEACRNVMDEKNGVVYE